MHSNLFWNISNNNLVEYDICDTENLPLNADVKGLFFGIHEKRGLWIVLRVVFCQKRGAVVSQLVPKLKESVPPPPPALDRGGPCDVGWWAATLIACNQGGVGEYGRRWWGHLNLPNDRPPSVRPSDNSSSYNTNSAFRLSTSEQLSLSLRLHVFGWGARRAGGSKGTWRKV